MLRLHFSDGFFSNLINLESASKGKSLTRNQEVILSASLVSVCMIAIVAVAMYFFRKKVLVRQKA